jgi:hypothetical protein
MQMQAIVIARSGGREVFEEREIPCQEMQAREHLILS